MKTVDKPLKLNKFFIGALFILVGAVCFSSKAILVKLAYQYHVDSVTLLMLRMAFSFPIFLMVAFFSSQKYKQEKITRPDWFKIMLFGILGYYLASFLDFAGLQYISASMERLILFVYPTIVVILSSILYKRKIKIEQLFALLLTYIGIFIIFWDHNRDSGENNLVLGGIFIFASAFTYAIYLIGSGELLPKVGTLRFTSYAMSSAALAVTVHYLLFLPVSLFSLKKEVYILAFIMAIVATVIPSFLISEGIKRIGSSNASILASIGPVSTIILAYIFLDERLTIAQLCGTVFIMVGVVLISLKGKN